jgi:hypothetical protein
MSYEAKDSLVRDRQLKVQEVCIPLAITGNATPASVSVVSDEPAIMFIRTEGVDGITEASGALDAGQTAPTFTSPDDATGVFAILIRAGEPVEKVVSAKLVSRSSTECVAIDLAGTGIDAIGDKICLNADSAVDLSAADLDCAIEVKYIAAE